MPAFFEHIFYDLVFHLLVEAVVEAVRNMGMTLSDLLLVVGELVFEHPDPVCFFFLLLFFSASLALALFLYLAFWLCLSSEASFSSV